MMTFSERIRRRLDIWWAVPGGYRNHSTWRRPLHRFLDTHSLRSRDWPMSRWRCCGQWQRSLNNKWNSREFAARLGVPVPRLHWAGRNLLRFPTNSLPTRCVVRRAWGAASLQTHIVIDGHELLDDRPCSPRQLHSMLLRQYGPVSIHPLLVEEFLGDEVRHDHRGMDYGFYCFGPHVAVISQEPVLCLRCRMATACSWHFSQPRTSRTDSSPCPAGRDDRGGEPAWRGLWDVRAS